MSNRWEGFEIGMRVRCTDPDGYVISVGSKLRNRVGTIKSKQPFSGNPIVEYPALGRRKAYTWVCSDPSMIEIAPD